MRNTPVLLFFLCCVMKAADSKLKTILFKYADKIRYVSLDEITKITDYGFFAKTGENETSFFDFDVTSKFYVV